MDTTHVASREEALVGITEILRDILGVPEEAITPDSHLFVDLGLDSLALLETVAHLEHRYGITILDEDVGHMVRVGAAADVVWERARQ